MAGYLVVSRSVLNGKLIYQHLASENRVFAFYSTVCVCVYREDALNIANSHAMCLLRVLLTSS